MNGTRQTWVPCVCFLNINNFPFVSSFFCLFVCLFSGCSSATLAEKGSELEKLDLVARENPPQFTVWQKVKHVAVSIMLLHIFE
jgi:hypothetical protein